MISEFELARTGDLPLRFRGVELSGASSGRSDGPGQNRWHELTLYRTAGGRYVLSVVFRSRWQGEDDHHHVEYADSPDGVRDALLRYPVPFGWVGYPSGETYREKQDRMAADLRRRFLHAVTEVFSGVEGFTEAVD